MELRRGPSVAIYEAGIGRLSRASFLRPDHDAKHYTSETLRDRKSRSASQFCKNLLSETLREIFWSWFDDIFALDDMDLMEASYAPLRFLHRSEQLWDIFQQSSQVRIAIDTTAPIGFRGDAELKHLAFDVGMSAGRIHAYPISEREAVDIMAPLPVRQIKSREYGCKEG